MGGSGEEWKIAGWAGRWDEVQSMLPAKCQYLCDFTIKTSHVTKHHGKCLYFPLEHVLLRTSVSLEIIKGGPGGVTQFSKQSLQCALFR